MSSRRRRTTSSPHSESTVLIISCIHLFVSSSDFAVAFPPKFRVAILSRVHTFGFDLITK
ncbi:hypothetical protein LINPERPRIM_LOCUS1149 [Linum perenne]